MILVLAIMRIMKRARIGKMNTMPASFLRSSSYMGFLSVQIGLVMNSVSSSSTFLSSWRVSSRARNERSMLLDSLSYVFPAWVALDVSCVFALSMIALSKGARDWSTFHAMRFENAMSVSS